MKKKLFFVLASILCASYIQAQPPGVVAHWDFTTNGTVAPGTLIPDISGNGHDGVVYGNVSAATGALGIANTALYFPPDATYGTYVLVPYDPGLNLASFTLSAIVKPVAFYTDNCQGNDIVCRGKDYTSGHYALVLCDNAYNNCNVADTSKYVFESTIGNTYYQDTDFQYTPTTVLNNWYTVDLSFDGLFIKVYFNGVLKSTVLTNGTGIGMSTDGLSIGAAVGNMPDYPYPFMGIIDDIVIFDRPLADTEEYSWRNGQMNAVSTVKQQSKTTTYPNPAKDFINIKSARSLSQANYVIKTVAGQTIQSGVLKTEQLPVTGLIPGIYYLELQTGEERTVMKFVKE